MPSFDYYFRFLQAGADILENFLLSSNLYWQVGVRPPPGEPPYPQLTLGMIYLTRLRARAFASSNVKQSGLEAVESRIDDCYQTWRFAWGKKAAREIRERASQWRNFLEDYRERPSANYDRYRYEVFRRVLIQLLGPDADELNEADREMVVGLDQLAKVLITRGGFIWEVELQPYFSVDEFWYLYGWLPAQISGDVNAKTP
jgi:hypothetical protein